MELDSGKPLSGPTDLQSEETSKPFGSHDVTLARSNGINVTLPKDLDENNLSEYHLTARVNNEQLGPREISLILSVLSYQIVHFGANFPMILTLTEFSMRLSNGRPSSEINDSNIRLSVLLSEILIKDLGRREFNLFSGNYVRVSSEVSKLLMPYLMTKRTYGSRYSTWRPEKFITVRAVPVSTLTERSKSGSVKYSGYTKGYGESHGDAHRKTTKPSAELDGEEVPDKEERNLILRVSDPNHQKANSLWIKFRNWLLGD